MKLSDWLIIGGAAWLVKKGMSAAAEERALQEAEVRQINQEYKQLQKESERTSAVNRKRVNTPCFFRDGFSAEEFLDLANRIGKRFHRIRNILVNEAIVICTVESQTGFSEWKFTVDFNDWGHITGMRWTWSENADSNIPEYFGNMMTSAIHQLQAERQIYIRSFSDAVDKNIALETEKGLNYRKKTGFIKKLFSKSRHILSHYNSTFLKGEHLYPVISLLRNNGFCNIQSNALKDVGRDSKNYLYEVEQVIINGSPYFEEGDVFDENSEVLIHYHVKQEILMPFSMRHFRKQHYFDVFRELETLGFSRIYPHPIKDLSTGWIIKDGSVERVVISGTDLQKNEIYPYDTEVIIEYHTFQNKRGF